MRRLLRPAPLLRLAAALTLLYAAGHGMGMPDSWSPPGETDVLQAMRTFRFDVMGASRTYWHFYVGFGAYITVLLLMQAVLLWQLASLAASHPSPARAMIGTLLAANIAGTVVVWRFIFALPAALSLVCAVCVALSFLTARSTIARS